jgi:hypothetical protein
MGRAALGFRDIFVSGVLAEIVAAFLLLFGKKNKYILCCCFIPLLGYDRELLSRR